MVRLLALWPACVGGIIYVVIYLPIALLYGMASMTEQLNRSGVHIPFSGTILVIIGSIVGAIVLVVLSTLGGVIGTAIFEKRKDGSTPPASAKLCVRPGMPMD